jgi:hypothetical protein
MKKYTFPLIMLTLLFVFSISFIAYSTVESIQHIVPSSITKIFNIEKTVNLGEEFTLRKSETARVKNLNVFIKIIDFTNSPCPAGTQCFWSGQAVNYELKVDGKIYISAGQNPLLETPYDITVKDSDYKTYTKLIINSPENTCTNQDMSSGDECFRGLAMRFQNQDFCNKIQSDLTKDSCLEELAELSNNINLCSNISSPSQFCLYNQLIKKNDLSSCDSIIIFHWRVRCYKDIAQTLGKGIEICDILPPEKMETCRQSISGADY